MRVLIIEDDRRMAALLEQGLREEGSQVTVCHDGREGLSLGLTPDFDVIVLDIMLPGLDGFEVARRLRLASRLTPTEYAILELLLRRRNRVVTRDAVIDEVWGGEREVESNTLDAFMKLLRSKVDSDPGQKLIHTKAVPISRTPKAPPI